MVTITKPPKRDNAAIFKKVAIAVVSINLLWIGYLCLSYFHFWFIAGAMRESSPISQLRTSSDSDQQAKEQRPLPKVKGAPQPEQNDEDKEQKRALHEQKSKSILTMLNQLSISVPISPPAKREEEHGRNADVEHKFNSAVTKECIPGRDDSSGEINKTTKRKRECLRHVPLGKGKHGIADNPELAERMRSQKPRIGIMTPPGYVGRSLAKWLSDAIKKTGEEIQMDVEVITTSHVPVYGYGKSHGYTKLIRLVTLPLALASYDAYVAAASDVIAGEGKGNDYYGDSLRDTLDEMRLGRNLSPPSNDSLGRMVQLILRWHCRLSHVSAHTAMLTLSLDDAIRDPADVLASVLSFVWREDWEWEGHGGDHRKQGSPRSGSWKREAEDLVSNDRDGSLQRVLERTELILKEAASAAEDDAAFKKSLQGAFASEMRRSEDMTAWPCPSFWEGVDAGSGGGGVADGDGGDMDMLVLRHFSGEMVPNCADDDPFVRCTVNRDRCEVRRDAKCK